MDGALFLPIFVGNIKCGIMENNNVNPSTGSKGVFPGGNVPGIAPNSTGAQNTAPEIKIPNPAPTQTAVAEVEQAPGNTKTYMRLESKNGEGQLLSLLEIDLIAFRERGLESRYLSLNTIGANSEGTQSDTTISIDNEADFNEFKDFISKLNWND